MGVKIGVFPASGALGSSIVNHLAKLVPVSDLVLVARYPEKLHDLQQAGAKVRKADYDELSTLDTAFEGVDVLMLISYASFEIDHRIKAHRLAINAAVKSGVKHIFYSSLGFGGDLTDHSIAHVMGAHIETEKYLSSLQDTISRTIVREGLYTESFPIYTSFFDPQNPADDVAIPHPGSGPGVAWVKRDELGEATAKLIVSYVNDPTSFEYLNKAVLLSGSREISLAETVEIIGRAIGQPLKIREISVDEYVNLPQIGDKHTYHGVDLSREWATAWEAIRRGETAVVSPALREILGREPENYETTIKALIG
ncbi:hypothetical protein N7519_002903 [Penicillium mononematosum]|uniref:uncharacterized protein n=1 Tax=Penicillium mononematosum TaxID=268346 RepID=UPI002548B4ED|nr:uncharacterized protein N7519_002903 [Penicillium mononematosum]KAJ6187995.1 hypothetical protein N7519_002903 [Penicillium mononematosum]